MLSTRLLWCGGGVGGLFVEGAAVDDGAGDRDVGGVGDFGDFGDFGDRNGSDEHCQD